METEQVINSFIRGDVVLKELLVFLSHHFSLSTYLRALLSSRQVCLRTPISFVHRFAMARMSKTLST